MARAAVGNTALWLKSQAETREEGSPLPKNLLSVNRVKTPAFRQAVFNHTVVFGRMNYELSKNRPFRL